MNQFLDSAGTNAPAERIMLHNTIITAGCKAQTQVFGTTKIRGIATTRNIHINNSQLIIASQMQSDFNDYPFQDYNLSVRQLILTATSVGVRISRITNNALAMEANYQSMVKGMNMSPQAAASQGYTVKSIFKSTIAYEQIQAVTKDETLKFIQALKADVKIISALNSTSKISAGYITASEDKVRIKPIAQVEGADVEGLTIKTLIKLVTSLNRKNAADEHLPLPISGLPAIQGAILVSPEDYEDIFTDFSGGTASPGVINYGTVSGSMSLSGVPYSGASLGAWAKNMGMGSKMTIFGVLGFIILVMNDYDEEIGGVGPLDVLSTQPVGTEDTVDKVGVIVAYTPDAIASYEMVTPDLPLVTETMPPLSSLYTNLLCVKVAGSIRTRGSKVVMQLIKRTGVPNPGKFVRKGDNVTVLSKVKNSEGQLVRKDTTYKEIDHDGTLTSLEGGAMVSSDLKKRDSTFERNPTEGFKAVVSADGVAVSSSEDKKEAAHLAYKKTK